MPRMQHPKQKNQFLNILFHNEFSAVVRVYLQHHTFHSRYSYKLSSNGIHYQHVNVSYHIHTLADHNLNESLEELALCIYLLFQEASADHNVHRNAYLRSQQVTLFLHYQRHDPFQKGIHQQ